MTEEELEIKKLSYKLEGYRQELAQKSEQVIDLRVQLTILDEENRGLRLQNQDLQPKVEDVQENSEDAEQPN